MRHIAPWSAQLLLALFSNPSLQTIQLNLKSFATPNPQENKGIAEAITKNTSVQELQIFLHADAKKNEFIIDAISENKNLTTLDILGKLPAGIGPILANMLRLNSNIKCLKFMVDWQDDLAELPAAMAAMSENNSVEALQFEQPYDFIEFRKEIIDPLLTNKNLKTLQVPHRGTFNPEVMATLTQLIGKHPNLSAIGPLHIPDKPHTFKAFIEDLKSNPNPQIQSISISWEEVLWIEGFDVKMPIYARYILDVFDALKAFPNLNHLSLHHLPDFDCLLEFLKHRPSISCIELPDDTLSSEQSQEKLLALVTSYSHITQFKFHDGYNKIKSGNEKKFQRDLQQALALNAEVRSEAAIENTSAAMNVLLLAHSQRNPELPVMNLDVIRQLVAAMVSYLPAEKVKAIFDDLVLYAPKNYASQIM
jgi:putative heme iron utilization protein